MESETKLVSIDGRFAGAIWNACPDGLLLVGADSTIHAANPQLEAILGYSPKSLEGNSLSILIPEKFKNSHADRVKRYFETAIPRPMGTKLDLVGLHRDGREVPVEVSLSPVPIEGERPVVLAVVRDVTVRRQMEQALRQHAEALARSNEELEQFAYLASHDLQEPLRTVANFLQLLKRKLGYGLSTECSEILNTAVRESERMRGLVTDLLAYSKVESQSKAGEASCNEVVNEVRQSLESLISENKATLDVDKLPTIPMNHNQAVVLFQNIVQNAIKYRGKAQPHISVKAIQEPQAWNFSITDNGIGIEPEYQNTIFKMFRRLHTKDEYPGSGIGLAICKKIVERHGGKIWVESKGRQAGSTFHFTVPQSGPVESRPR